ncbi:MAG: hypothetical protein HY840_01255 [Bacteroidetes bacterium]|nr:hypothetical protein [Bacteroidota bacterium]
MQIKKNILILTYWSYKDALIQTYTLPYVRIIRKIISDDSKIFFVTFENNFHAISPAENKKIKQQLADKNISWISYSYRPLGVIALLKNIFSLVGLLWLCISKKITHIHAWCTPAGSLGYVLSILTGKPLIIDSYEPHAEAMVENGTWNKNGIAYKLLLMLEKLQSRRATTLIACSSGMKEYAFEKYQIDVAISFFTKPACVNLDLFSFEKAMSESKYLRKKWLLKDKIVCVYAGKFGGIYLDQEIFHFIRVAAKYWGGKFRVLLLTNTSREQIDHYAEKTGVNKEIIISQFVEHKEIPGYLALADFAINPVKPVPTKKYCTSIKDGEYWAMGLPVVIPENISDDSDIIERNETGAILHALDEENYLVAVKIIDALLNSTLLQKKKGEIRNIAKKFRGFEIAEKIYQQIYLHN